VSAVMRASRLWDKYWMADETLAEEEVRELAFVSSYLRKTFLRRNRRKQLFSVLLNARDYFFPAPRLDSPVELPKVSPF